MHYSFPFHGGDFLTAFEELNVQRTPGPQTIELLQRLVAQVTRPGTFPPPGGHQRWSDQAVLDHIGTLLSRKNGMGFIVSCFLKSDDQGALERQLLSAIKNDLIDEAKATPVGKLRRRMHTLLSRDSRFVDASSLFASQAAWSLPENRVVPSYADVDELFALTVTVEAAPIESLPPAGRTPRAARESLLTMTHSALKAVDAALRAQTLANFLTRRFGLAAPSTITGFDGERAAAPADPSASYPEAEQLAADVFADLTSLERSMIPLLGDPGAVEQLYGEAGLAVRERVRERLRILVGSELGRDALGPLQQMCSTGVSE
jgi:hypothetical protein